jgi:hypothetical protein
MTKKTKFETFRDTLAGATLQGVEPLSEAYVALLAEPSVDRYTTSGSKLLQTINAAWNDALVTLKEQGSLTQQRLFDKVVECAAIPYGPRFCVRDGDMVKIDPVVGPDAHHLISEVVRKREANVLPLPEMRACLRLIACAIKEGDPYSGITSADFLDTWRYHALLGLERKVAPLDTDGHADGFHMAQPLYATSGARGLSRVKRLYFDGTCLGVFWNPVIDLTRSVSDNVVVWAEHDCERDSYSGQLHRLELERGSVPCLVQHGDESGILHKSVIYGFRRGDKAPSVLWTDTYGGRVYSPVGWSSSSWRSRTRTVSAPVLTSDGKVTATYTAKLDVGPCWVDERSKSKYWQVPPQNIEVIL